VPSATIQRASFGTFVYVVTPEGKATIRKVTLGAAEGEWVAITEGVQPGERVVLEGVDSLREGVTVEVVGTGAPPPPSTDLPVARPDARRPQAPAAPGGPAAPARTPGR